MTAIDDPGIERRETLLDEWVELRRQIAVLDARASSLLAERMLIMDEDVRDHPFHRDAIRRSMISEFAAAGHMSTGTVDRSFSDAATLERWFPVTREAYTQGRITVAHMREIVLAGQLVHEAVQEGRADAEVLAAYDTAACVAAEIDTPARTRVHVRGIAAALVGDTLNERHRRAADERTVTMRSVDDGLALLSVVLPEFLAVAIFDRLTQAARSIVTARDDREPVLDPSVIDDGEDPVYPEHLSPEDPACDDAWADRVVIFGSGDTFTIDPCHGDPGTVRLDPLETPLSDDIEHLGADTRTLDQIRADLLADLLLSSDPSEAHGTGLDNITARVQVTVAATTLVGADERPAELDGFGPMAPEIARSLAGGSGGWSRLFLDPQGMVTETDAYSPTEGMRRLLRARDQHCRFPGCRMPTHRCEIDHNHDHAKGGPTSIDNLCHLCVTHHSLKHPAVDDRYRWTARALPDGTLHWVSPLGRPYSDPPPRRVMFV